MKPKILVVDDEPDVIDLLAMNLKSAGYAVLIAEDGATALDKARSESPDLIILDLMLPQMPGLEVCKALKSEPSTKRIPIIVLSAKSEEVDKIVGLELGADDYVTKPFSPREVVLRVKSVLSRGRMPETSEEVMHKGVLKLDRARHYASLGNKPLDLTATEFKLLGLLMERCGRVQARDRLLDEVWGYEVAIDTRTVDTHVRRLREKLGKHADVIETVRGVGYRIRDE